LRSGSGEVVHVRHFAYDADRDFGASPVGRRLGPRVRYGVALPATDEDRNVDRGRFGRHYTVRHHGDGARRSRGASPRRPFVAPDDAGVRPVGGEVGLDQSRILTGVVKAESVLLLVRRHHPEHLVGNRNEVGSAPRHGIGDPGAGGRRKVGEYPAPPEKGDAVEGAVVRLLHREQAAAHGLAHSHRRSHIDRRDLWLERAASQLIEDGDSRCVVGRRQLLVGQRQHVLRVRAVTGRQVVTRHEYVS
jgi:hypothetical protein